MANLTNSFDVLLEEDTWMEAAAIFAGFLFPTVVRNVLEPNTPFDAPDEVYGLAVMVGGQYAPMYQTQITTGGGLYTVDKVAQRAGIKQRVTSMGAN